MKDLRQEFIENRIRELQDSTDFVNSLLRCISTYSIIVGDFDGNVIVFNEGARHVFGYDPVEVVGLKNIEEFFPAGFIRTGQLGRLFDELVSRGEYSYELDRERKNGEVFSGHSLLTLVKDNQDRLVGFVEITEDVTDRKQKERLIKELYRSERKQRKELEASEAFTQDLLIHAPNPILVTDRDTSIVHANPAFEKLSGYTLIEIIGKKAPYPWWTEETIHLFRNNDREQLLKASRGAEVRHINKEQKPFWIIDNIESIKKHDNVEYYLSNWVDISLRKQAEDQLEKANQKLVELDKLKDDFLNIAAHELRTPLTSIKCYTELLIDYDEERLQQLEFLGVINQETDRLIRIINDFLDITKIQSGRMQWHMEEVLVTEVIRHTINTSLPLVKEAGLELVTDFENDLPRVIVDRDKLIQVITNLLGNSIKFTPQGGSITVKVGWTRDTRTSSDPGMVNISISDTGIGIDPQHFDLIFQNFGQVGETIKDKPKGTGLGLPICKKIVEHLGGTIRVESVKGRGSTFTFTIPAVKLIDPDSKISVSASSLNTTSPA